MVSIRILEQLGVLAAAQQAAALVLAKVLALAPIHHTTAAQRSRVRFEDDRRCPP